MNSRAWIVILLFLLWGGVSWRWYTCGVKGYCGDTSPVTNTAPIDEEELKVEADHGPLSFTWKESAPVTSPQWNSYLQGILDLGNDGSVLVISGPYYNDEQAPEGFENMGLARADRVRSLLDGKVDASRIELSSHSLGAGRDAVMHFAETRFQWVSRNENVQETMDGALIYFPYKSDEKIANPNIADYLDRLAVNLKSNKATVKVIGHTDSVGGDSYNYDLGLSRAVSIKEILVAKGVPADRIVADSKGEKQPIADNATDEGREKNRRTEIIISQ